MNLVKITKEILDNRRHLNESQRAMVAAKLANMKRALVDVNLETEKSNWTSIQEILFDYLRFVKEQNENQSFDRKFGQDERAEEKNRDG